MIFKPELAAKVLTGRKTQTRRVVSGNPRSPWAEERCMYQEGRVYAVQPGRGKTAIGRIRVLEVRQTTLGSLTHEEAVAEGFASIYDFKGAWREINGVWWPKTVVWALTFEVAR